jgi:hypothetical protein
MSKNDTLWLIAIIVIIILNIVYCNLNEKFNVWNIPTRWPYPLYDIRGYPQILPDQSYYFLHRGKLYNSKYIDISLYPELYYYLPYYYNGMIYTASGSYNYDQFAKYYDMPILYQIPGSTIDWLGLVNNGIIKVN